MDIKKQENLQLMHQLHSQRLASASNDVSRLRGFVRDYETLVDTLTALPTKTHHQALIPLGGAALMPGRLVHTNEVLVLLGDNWFAERTALQARDIAGRRLQDCRDQLKSAEQAAKLQSHWVEQGETLKSEQGIDIVEEVSEEEYAKQQERHREMVRAHRQQLRQERLQQHNVSSKATSKKRRTGATSVTGHSEQGHKAYDDLMKRLDALEDMERDEGSEEAVEEGSGSAKDSEELEDDLSEETDEDETSDSDSDDDKETQPNRTAAENDDGEEEDSDEDLPADLNKFKHVKIESPMPSSERKFQYSDADPDGVEDELGDMEKVEEVIRGRTRSFTRSVDGDHPRSDSKGRDSSSDSRTGGGGGGPRGPAARRVSWADQSPYIVSEDGGGGAVIKIRYVATQKAAGEDEPGNKEETTVETATAEGTPLVTVITIPPLDDSQTEAMETDSKSSSVRTPADLVRLAGDATADSRDKETHSSVPITVVLDPPAPAVAPALPTITATASRKPKKSILKRAPSQDGAVVDTVAGVSWLQSAESVPITNVYHHEPIVEPSSEEASELQQDSSVPPAVKSRVVARGEAISTDPPVKGEEQELTTKKMSKFKAGRLKQ